LHRLEAEVERLTVLESARHKQQLVRELLREFRLPEADAIITDIPWDGKWLEHVEDFAAWCAAKLKPDGIVTTLYSAHNLDRLLADSRSTPLHLDVLQPLVKGRPSLSPYLVRHCTLCVVYSNTRKPYFHQRPKDLLPETCGEEHRWHEHQQSLSVTQYLVETFAPEGSLVVDPCSGGWTTAVACYRAGRKFLGSDDRPDCLDVARRRFTELLQPYSHVPRR